MDNMVISSTLKSLRKEHRMTQVDLAMKSGVGLNFVRQLEQKKFRKAENLFMTGQNVYLHGCCGVPLTAVMTAEAVMGEKDGIVKKLEVGSL